MKGFPNQVADLNKIGVAISTLVELVDGNRDARDDGVFGEALVRAGVAGTGHKPRPIEQYLKEQRRKEPGNQSFRTTARGLRELFRLMSLIEDAGQRVRVTELGRTAAQLTESAEPERIEFWRKVISNIIHTAPNGDTSHPYQMLLRLVGRKPGITRAKCALALEARNDSAEELERIVALADLEEEVICQRIGVTKSNWDNAKKVLPKFAEQLNDVVRRGHSFWLARSPGGAESKAPTGQTRTAERRKATRAPRGSREVTPATIATANTDELFDEMAIPPDLDPAAAQAAVRQRRARFRRHQQLVTALAERLSQAGADLHADPFDALAEFEDAGVLVEVKTLDGSAPDERSRVMEALSQLLYYEAFVTTAAVGAIAIHKIACFEAPITKAHQEWLNKAGIGSIWRLADGRFAGDALAARVLSSYIEELH
jgi:hypothetical protein